MSNFIGKSSLLSAILGEMVRSEPDPKCEAFCGSVAYAAQLPWILNLTVKDNILFGRPFERTLYDEVLKASGLEQDLGVLPGGDLTEIGVSEGCFVLRNLFGNVTEELGCGASYRTRVCCLEAIWWRSGYVIMFALWILV